MKLKFTKMQALGNDFIVIDAVSQPIQLSTRQVVDLCDRHFGVGCDQLLLVEPVSGEEADFFYRIYNADGSEVSQCGNGVRCLARFIDAKKLSTKKTLHIGTRNTKMITTLQENHHISVDMGHPIFDEANIPFISEKIDFQEPIMALSMGNPHAVLWVDSIEEAPVITLGGKISKHPCFPAGANVEFMQKLSDHAVKLRVYERGAGETLACGSGACAAVVAGVIQNKLKNSVQVELLGGTLMIEWAGESHPVKMTGPAEFVFEGEIDI